MEGVLVVSDYVSMCWGWGGGGGVGGSGMRFVSFYISSHL